MLLNARAFFVIRINTKNSFILVDLIYDYGIFFFFSLPDDCSSCLYVCVMILLRVSMRNADRIERINTKSIIEGQISTVIHIYMVFILLTNHKHHRVNVYTVKNVFNHVSFQMSIRNSVCDRIFFSRRL